jgi:heat-inducible transcriptional repressor
MRLKLLKLTERQQRVLWATVHRYIATAEPVGSKALVEEYDLAVSSATIRNIMGVLENLGLLYQPHTSAGRVPSDSGYRIYVDDLLTPDLQLSAQIEQLLVAQLNPGSWSLEAMLRGAAQILGMFSGYIALVTLPQTVTAAIRCIQLVRVEETRLMLILITESYETQSALMELPLTSDQDKELIDRELEVLGNFLNHHLQGCLVGDLSSLDWQSLDQDFQRYSTLLCSLLQELAQRIQPNTSPQMLMAGLSKLLSHPEFAEPQQLSTLLHVLEGQQDQLWPLMGEVTLTGGLKVGGLGQRVKIHIGSENPLAPMQSCTLVSSTYQRGSSAVGSVGVLGPTRMPYEKVIPLVEATAEYLTDSLSTLAS